LFISSLQAMFFPPSVAVGPGLESLRQVKLCSFFQKLPNPIPTHCTGTCYSFIFFWYDSTVNQSSLCICFSFLYIVCSYILRWTLLLLHLLCRRLSKGFYLSTFISDFKLSILLLKVKLDEQRYANSSKELMAELERETSNDFFSLT
jgi:hypothetical protein